MSRFVDQLRDSQKTCYFVSPHFDDMAFSAGALASHLNGSNRVVVVNVFTKAGPSPYTISAKAYLRQCSFSDAEKLYAEREQEDKSALSLIADEVRNLDLTEALWRPRNNVWLKRLGAIIPEFGKIYPTYRLHISKGKISKGDRPTIDKIKQQLERIVDPENAVIFCPLGVGGHVDHVATRLACEELFPSLIYWSDFPYNMQANDVSASKQMKSITFGGGKRTKAKLIKAYATQYAAIFGNGLKVGEESFFYRSKGAKKFDDKHFA